jgi:hypothetical protein
MQPKVKKSLKLSMFLSEKKRYKSVHLLKWFHESPEFYRAVFHED